MADMIRHSIVAAALCVAGCQGEQVESTAISPRTP